MSKDEAHAVTKDRQQKEIVEPRVQLLETTVKRLEEELVEKTARLNKMCHEMKEDIRIFKKYLKSAENPPKFCQIAVTLMH